MKHSESWESALTIVVLYGQLKIASRDHKQRVSGNSGRVTKTSSNILPIDSQSATNFCIMENLIRAFTCVLRHQNDADGIINNVDALLDGTGLVTDISDIDRLGILDLPDQATQEANSIMSTKLSRAELLERAASSPSQLSIEEIVLLEQRFWLDLTATETNAQRTVHRALAVSEEVFYRETDRLKKVRAMLYDNNEEAALWNAGDEKWRRLMVSHKEKQKQEVESQLPFAQPWVRRLWDEDQGEKNWGYAVYHDPEADSDEYECRRDATLSSAKTGAGCVSLMACQWRLQRLDWPDNPILCKTPLYNIACEHLEYLKHIETLRVPGRPTLIRGPQDIPDIYTTSQLLARFQVLRQHFRAARDHASGGQSIVKDAKTSSGGLLDGMLRNVFLVIDQQCVQSLLSERTHPDARWVYAVDPDYLQSSATTADETYEYRGYMRVRIRELASNFFHARRYHEGEFPMQTMWHAAQRRYLQALVSVEEAEAAMTGCGISF
jgi:hypothetical protein